MAEQKSNSKYYIATIIVLIAIIIGGVIYFIVQNQNKGETKTETINSLAPETADITDDTNASTYTKDTLLGKLECVKDQKPDADYCKIDSAKILNATKGITYTWTEDDGDFEKLAKVEINKDDPKKATVKFDEKLVERFYDEKGLNFPIYLTFSSDVDSYKVAGFGQGVGDEYIFFIMKNGNVAMLSVYSMLKDKKYDPIMVKNVKDVVAIHGGGSYDDYIGGHTNYAITKNQTAYNLQPLLPGWGGNQ